MIPATRRRLCLLGAFLLAPRMAAAQAPLDPAAPLAELPDMGVDWPDLDAAPAAPAEAGTEVAAGERSYGYSVTGVDMAAQPMLRDRFNAASALRAGQAEPANAAQVERRAREDAELLGTLLRAEGYYDAEVEAEVAADGGRFAVTLTAEPGERYTFADVRVAGEGAAGVRDDLPLKPGDPVDADAIAAAEARLRTEVGESGFPFAAIGEPEVVVDRAARTATLSIDVATGAARRFGRITGGNPKVFDAEHIADIARFQPGDPFAASELTDLRRAIIQTGLVSAVTVTPQPGATPDTVDIAVALEPAPPRTVAAEAGYGTGEGARAELSWTHRNLFPPEGALTLRSVLGTREQLGSVLFRRSNFNGRDRVFTGQLTAAHLNRNAYDARTLSLSATLERQTNIFFQKAWIWSIGAELAASDERDVILATGERRRRTYFIGALPTSITYDASDDLLNPTRGFRLGGRLSPELSLVGQAFGYARTQIDASAYQPLSSRVVIAGRARLGTILGAPRDAIAPSRRFYAGGGASVRGYGFQDIGPRDLNNDPVGGRSLTELSVEARVQAFGNFGIVPFLDAGNIYTSALPRFTGFRFGTGLGVRYYSNFGPIRVDVGTPINPQPGDPRIAVYVSLGQAF